MSTPAGSFNPYGIFSYNFNPATINTRSFAGAVFRLWPNGTATLFGLTSQMSSGTAKAVEHGYHTKVWLWAKPAVTNGPYNSAATTITVDSTAGIVPGVCLQVPATREVVRVVSVDSATQLSIARGFGRIAAGSIADAAVLFCVGNAHVEASVRPTSRTIKPTYVPNYTHITRTAWAISDTARAHYTDLPDFKNVAENKMDATNFHSTAMEEILFFGQALAPTTDAVTGKTIHSTQGIIDAVYQYASTNVTDMNATTDYDELVTAVEGAFDYSQEPNSSGKRAMFVDNTGMKVLTDIGRFMPGVHFNMTPKDSEFGFSFDSFKFYKGMIYALNHPLFNGAMSSSIPGLAVGMDLTSMRMVYMDGREMRVEEYGNGRNQDAGIDADGGSFTTEFATEFKNPNGCFVLNGLTAGVASSA